jgi:hypothetical protein
MGLGVRRLTRLFCRILHARERRVQASDASPSGEPQGPSARKGDGAKRGEQAGEGRRRPRGEAPGGATAPRGEQAGEGDGARGRQSAAGATAPRGGEQAGEGRGRPEARGAHEHELATDVSRERGVAVCSLYLSLRLRRGDCFQRERSGGAWPASFISSSSLSSSRSRRSIACR